MPHGSGFVPDVPDVSVKKFPPSGLFARENPCVGGIFYPAQRHGRQGERGMLGGGEDYCEYIAKYSAWKYSFIRS